MTHKQSIYLLVMAIFIFFIWGFAQTYVTQHNITLMKNKF